VFRREINCKSRVPVIQSRRIPNEIGKWWLVRSGAMKVKGKVVDLSSPARSITSLASPGA